jgi:hypothetical protein
MGNWFVQDAKGTGFQGMGKSGLYHTPLDTCTICIYNLTYGAPEFSGGL